MSTQLPLGLGLRDDTTFDNYCVGDNEPVLASIRNMLQGTGEAYIYLWGERGVGRSHLLQACCHALDSANRSSIYLPLAEHGQLSPEMLDGMEDLDLICLDNVSSVLGQRVWEEAIFHLYNRILQSGAKLLITSDVVPSQLPCIMPDLRSRLSQGLILQVQPLNDEQKLAVLQLRAKRRGLELSDDVGLYILRHYPRNMASLFELLIKLDKASLVMQRKLTIPFVKSVLEAK
jgi:DnaA family protein